MAKQVMGPDGHYRTDEEERRLNLIVLAALGTPSGEEVMKYLRSITIEVAAGPKITDAELRHLEGMRFLTGLLSQRINLGHKAKSHVDDKEK